MIWKDFKKIVESQGIKNDTEISYIDSDMYKPTVHFENNKAYIDGLPSS